jgi:RNA-directed DNA polymerase
MLRLIKMWLKVPVEERDENGKPRVGGGKGSNCGTPQGGVITPRTQTITSSLSGL